MTQLDSLSKAHRIYADKGFVLGAVDNVVVAIWRAKPTLEMLERVGASLEKLTNDFPGNCAYIAVIEPTAENPPAEVRRYVKELLKRVGSKLRCVATVLEGSGVKQTTFRLVQVSLLAFSDTHQVFSKVRDAETWIGNTIKVTSLALNTEVERLRAAS